MDTERTIQDATADAFFAAVCPKEEKTLPGIGRCWVHGLTDLEVQQWLESCEKDPDNADRVKDPYVNAKLIQRTVRNAAGQPIFSPGQVTRIVNLPNPIKQVLLDAARRLSALGEQVDEETLKNCGRTPGSGS